MKKVLIIYLACIFLSLASTAQLAGLEIRDLKNDITRVKRAMGIMVNSIPRAHGLLQHVPYLRFGQ